MPLRTYCNRVNIVGTTEIQTVTPKITLKSNDAYGKMAIVAFYDQAMKRSSLRQNRYGKNVPEKCRTFEIWNMIMAHTVVEYPKVAQGEYKKWRHDNISQEW